MSILGRCSFLVLVPLLLLQIHLSCFQVEVSTSRRVIYALNHSWFESFESHDFLSPCKWAASSWQTRYGCVKWAQCSSYPKKWSISYSHPVSKYPFQAWFHFCFLLCTFRRIHLLLRTLYWPDFLLLVLDRKLGQNWWISLSFRA